jgi:hypothetical protein
MNTESTSGTRCYKVAQRLTGLGIAIAPGKPGDTFSRFKDCQNQATTLMSRVTEWMTTGYPLPDGPQIITPDHSWICMARSGGVGCLDIDDYAECLKRGMPPIPEGVFTVDSAGSVGGDKIHLPFMSTPETDALGNRAVRRDPEDPSSEKIFELKVHNVSWCGPWQQRADGGVYRPRDSKAPLMAGLPDFIAWIVANTKGRSNRTSTDWDFHEDWDQDDFLTHNECEYRDDWKDDDGTFYLNVMSCPICNEASRQNGRGCQVKFMFSGRGYGFTCKFCGIEGEGARKVFEEKMEEEHSDWEPWDEPIYERADTSVSAEWESPDELMPEAPAEAAEPTEICQSPTGSNCPCPRTHAYNQEPTQPPVDLTEDYSAKLIAIVLTDPDVEKDFVFYRKRLGECVKVLAARRVDKRAAYATQSKALEQLLAFEWEFKKLPTKTEFGDYAREHAPKAAAEIAGLIEHLPTVAGLTLDFVAPKLISQCQLWQEAALWYKAFSKLKKEGTSAARAELTQGWRNNAVWGETVRTVGGALQENTDQILARFTALLPENQQPGATTSFSTPFPTLNAAFGLNSADRLLAFVGSNNNFKTAVLTNCAHHLATEGKNVLFVTGEHESEIVEDRLVWMFRKFIGEDVLLSLRDWNDHKGSRAELDEFSIALQRLKSMREMPGFIMVKKFNDSDCGGDISQILDFMEQTFDKNQWKALVIDPFEALVANADYDTKYFASEKVGARLLSEKTAFHNGEGLVILTSFQLHDKSKDAVKKLQASPSALPEDYEEALRIGSLNMFKWADNVFDGLMGVAQWSNWQTTGVITYRRMRFGRRFEPLTFKADPQTFLMEEEGAQAQADLLAKVEEQKDQEKHVKEDKAELKKRQNRKIEPWKGAM